MKEKTTLSKLILHELPMTAEELILGSLSSRKRLQGEVAAIYSDDVSILGSRIWKSHKRQKKEDLETGI